MVPSSLRARRASFRPALEVLEDRRVPATVKWNTNGDGDFLDASRWDVVGTNPIVHRVPGPGDDAVIDFGASDYTVTFTGATHTVGSLSSNKRFALNGGSLTVTHATAPQSLLERFSQTGGTFTTLAGTTVFSSGGTLAGTFHTAANASLIFSGRVLNVDNYLIGSGFSLTGPGQFAFANFATLIVNTPLQLPENFSGSGFGALVLNADVTAGKNLTLDVNVSGSNNLVVPSGNTLTWLGGTMSGTGTTTVRPGATLALASGRDRTITRPLDNAGTATWSGSGNLQINAGGAFNNLAGATFAAQNDAILLNGGGPFNNAGTFTKTSAVGGTTLASAFINNTGTVNIQSGFLRLTGGFVSSGTFDLAAGTELLMAFAGAYMFNAGSRVVGAGVARSVDGPGVTVNGSVTMSNFAVDSGTLTGPGNLTVTGTFDWNGGSIRDAAGTLTLPAGSTVLVRGNRDKTLNGRTVNLAGAATWRDSGNLLFESGATLNVQSGGSFTAANDQTIFAGNFVVEATINNSGTFTKSGGLGTTIGSFGLLFNNNGGTVSVQSGTLSFFNRYLQNAGTTTVAAGTTLSAAGTTLNGGVLTGSGTVGGAVTNAATVRPGSSPGVLTVTGAYTQTAAGTLDIELAGTAVGTGFDQLAVGGAATLAGTLVVRLTGGFNPAIGDTFPVLTYASRSGDFATKTGLDLSPTRRLTTTAGAATYTLTAQPINAGTLQFAAATASASEGAAATVTVTRTGGSDGPVSLTYSTSGGTATSGSDYVPATGTLTWADGDVAPRTFLVYALSDTAADPNETVTLTLANPTGGATVGTPATATLTLTDVPLGQPGTPVQFSAATFSANRSSGRATVTVTRGSGTGTATVVYATADGSARAGADYTAASGTLTFAAGEMNKTVLLSLLNDELVGDETVLVSLSNPGAGAVLGSTVNATLTIRDDVSSSAARFVHQAYLDLLRRGADLGGLLYWARGIEQGAFTRDQTARALLASIEYRALLVAEQYRAFLRRDTEAGGLNFWVDYVGQGRAIEDLKSQILGSDEYFRNAGATNAGYLTQLYRDLFGRDIEADGRAFWLSRLDAGALTRPQLAVVFATVKETLDTLNAGFIRLLLRRDPRPGEVDPYTSGIQGGRLRDEDVVRTLVASDEYFARLGR